MFCPNLSANRRANTVYKYALKRKGIKEYNYIQNFWKKVE